MKSMDPRSPDDDLSRVLRDVSRLSKDDFSILTQRIETMRSLETGIPREALERVIGAKARILPSELEQGVIQSVRAKSAYEGAAGWESDGEYDDWNVASSYKFFQPDALDGLGNNAEVTDQIKSRLAPQTILRLADATQESLKSFSAESIRASQFEEAERQRVEFVDARLTEVIQGLVRNPELRYSMQWRDFEVIYCEILNRLGWVPTLGPGSKDGGIDIFAERKDQFRMIMAVQCKRHKKGRSISPNMIQSLHSVVTHGNFNLGVFVTTTTFQPAARKFVSELKTLISLEDGEEFVRRLKSVIRG